MSNLRNGHVACPCRYIRDWSLITGGGGGGGVQNGRGGGGKGSFTHMKRGQGCVVVREKCVSMLKGGGGGGGGGGGHNKF